MFLPIRNADGVYVLNTGMYRSNDGGKTFRPIRVPHGDNHGLWIDPNDPNRMIESNDGGANVSTNGGASWTNQATSQLRSSITWSRTIVFLISFTVRSRTTPQWQLPARRRAELIAQAGMRLVAARADTLRLIRAIRRSFTPVLTAVRSRAMTIARKREERNAVAHQSDWRGGGRPEISLPVDGANRFSPHDPKTLYFAAQVLFKSTDEGMNWQIISPDLTRNDKSKQVAAGGPITKDNTGVEVYDTIFSVAESPMQKDLIWAGSDDGLIHVTTDGGKNWANVTPKAMPEWGTVSMIEASLTTRAQLMSPCSATRWMTLLPTSSRPRISARPGPASPTAFPRMRLFTRCARTRSAKGCSMPARNAASSSPGTMARMAVVADQSAGLTHLRPDVHGNDLVVATHGRAFWVLDDLSPLRQYKPEMANEEVHLYAPSVANHTTFGGGSLAAVATAGKIRRTER